MDDLIVEFLTETSESLATLDQELVRFEQNPNDRDILMNIFRLMHTIKGTCGFLGLPRLEKVAHAGEDVLGKFRDGVLLVTPEAVSLILASIDRIRELLQALEASGQEPAGDDGELVSRLRAMAEGKAAAAAAPAAVPPARGEMASGGLSLTEAALVQQSFQKVAPIKEQAAEIFYNRLFELDPSLRALFKADIKEQGRKLMATLGAAVAGLNNPAAIVPVVEDLGRRHVGYGVKEAHFDTVGAALLWTLEKGLGADFTAPVKEAWTKCFAFVADIMRRVVRAAAPTAPQASAGGFPVAAELLAEVEQALAGGARAATNEELAAAMEAERAAEAAKGGALVEDRPAAVPVPVASPSAPPKPLAPAAAKVPAPADGQGKESAAAAQSIRVNVDVLENLMTLVSEMVLTRNNLLQLVRGKEDSEFASPLQRLSLITSDLQEGIMKTRMQPIGNAWSKLPRIVRDLSVELKKKIELKMVGAETELDRQVLEKIKDPLTHMVRNSADHGIERPADRLAAGKPEEGTINLRAFHEGGHIIIEITDDGRGLNVEKIKKKIVEKGLAGEMELAQMDEAQIQQFIMKPGFSTAEKVTNVSGRGVGMDVVKTNIEAIGGTVLFKSVAGKGSIFTIKIPLTLAIVSGLIVECGGERFAIPQRSVRELVRVSERSEHRIELISDSPVLRLRSRLLPLVSLRDTLKLAERKDYVTGEYYVVVTQIGDNDYGIIVDRVFDTEEIVVKPVAPVLRDIPYYSGNTILGDGSVIMILDPNGIAADAGQKTMAVREDAETAPRHAKKPTPLLVFRAGGEERKAVPMALVARLEEINLKTVEVVNGRRVVQYREHLMPLICINPGHSWKSEGRQVVLVFTDRERAMGLVVDEIVDIVEDHLDIELGAEREGLVGSAIIAGKATEIVDIGHYLTLAHRDWFGAASASGADDSVQGRRILIVDDSPFFRGLLVPYLSAAGFQVTAAENAEEALLLRDEGLKFDVIISDIEMPGMNGYDFARNVLTDSRWAQTPLLALSSNASPQHIEQGRKAGFRNFIAKTKRSELLKVLTETLAQVGQMGEAA